VIPICFCYRIIDKSLLFPHERATIRRTFAIKIFQRTTMQQYWLAKSEPYVFSFEDLQRDGTTRWDGVRNYQARNNLRAMRLGDIVVFYHSNEGLAAVGLARVSREHYPDPTAESGDWSCVDMVPHQPLQKHVPLAELKAHPALQQIGIVRNPRLSVMPLSADEFATILGMAATELV
jgi:predicted RNA-binding protein with PUA-like domain